MKWKRKVYRVRYRPEWTDWTFGVYVRNKVVTDNPDHAWGSFERKTDCVRECASLCRHRRRIGSLTQMVVHNKDGRIAFERTYGADPKRSKG